MRYLIVDEKGNPYMLLLPAKPTLHEAEEEVRRLEKIVEKNNEQYTIARLYEKGDCFRFRRDTRVFRIKEID